ncbi:glycoside hydrolase, partial [Pseudomonas sp. FW306-02-F08-AA]
AAPYHDWNDRITAECYAPNGASRITDRENKIIRIMNNYSRMSFNFGPTLLSWLADNAPRAYRMILDADHASAERHSGHGSAIAQVY